MSVAAAVSAFLGNRVFDASAFTRLETGWAFFNSRVALVLAAVAFLMVVGVAVWVWLPLAGSFTNSGQLIVATHIEGAWPPISMGELYRELALSTNESLDSNRMTLRGRQRGLAWAMGALALEIVMMLLVLWDLVK